MADRNPSRSGVGGASAWVGFGPFAFDRDTEQLRREGVEVHLAPRAAAVLRELVERPGEAVSKDELLDGVWNGTPVTEDALIQAISLVRQALGDDPRNPRYVATVARHGYRFVEAVDSLEGGPIALGDNVSAANGQTETRLRESLMARVAAGMLLVGGAAALGWSMRPIPPVFGTVTVRMEIHPPAGVELPSQNNRESLAISADGRYVAFVGDRGAERSLYVRDLREFEAVPVGDDLNTGIRGGSSAFFLPDNAWVGFWRGEGFWRVPREGGSPIVLLEDAHPQGMAWLSDGSLLYRWNLRLWHRVPGQEPRQLGEGNLKWPDVMPGERYVVACWIRHGLDTAYDANIFVIDLATGEQRELPFRGTAPRYAESGHLLFARDNALFAVPFDLQSAQARGVPVKVLDGIATSNDFAVPSWAIAANGTLAYRPVAGPDLHRVAWVDQDGETEILLEGPPHGRSASSPDGRYLALGRGASAGNLQLYDLERGTQRPLVPPGFTFAPVWAPDSSRLFYLSSGADGIRRIMAVDPALPAGRRSLLEGPTGVPVSDPSNVWSMHPDGRRLAYAAVMRGSTGYDVRILDVGADAEGGAEPYTLLGGEFDENWAEFSPDGNWLAYLSNETGRREVYITDFPGAGQRLRVSTAGGASPRWAPDMSVLYYQEESRIMRVTLDLTGRPRLGAPELAVDAGLSDDLRTGFDLSADGTRFLVITDEGPPPIHQINVVLNWFEELERMVPTDR